MAMPLPIFAASKQQEDNPLRLNTELLARWLVSFLSDECIRRRGMRQAVIGMSGGVDSAVTAYLCARAFGRENTLAVRMPYRLSSQSSLDHAQVAADKIGIPTLTVPITEMVDGYAANLAETPDPQRLGNICARCRMIVLFDQAARVKGLPIGTGNKSERLFGYFTWHADDSPPINPLGDLFKSQVWDLARELGVPSEIVDKAPTADLTAGQTDEGDFGITYAKADLILHYMTEGYPQEKLLEMGFDKSDVSLVWKRVASTHWKRRLPTTALVSDSAVGEFYLRPVDY